MIQQKKYEEYVLIMLNRSNIIFPNNSFCRIKDQSNGECDYLDCNGKKYDAKLLIDKHQGQLLGDQNIAFREWVEDVKSEINEFYNVAKSGDFGSVSKTRLFNIMVARLNALKEDENAIFFVPFPLVDDFDGSFSAGLVFDFIDCVYSQLKKENKIGARAIYFIYPSRLGKWVLRDQMGNREYISVPELDSFATFSLHY